MADMARTGRGSEMTCRTSIWELVLKQEVIWISISYCISPQAPRAGSYNPPGTGFKRVSKVVGFCMAFTDRRLISS